MFQKCGNGKQLQLRIVVQLFDLSGNKFIFKEKVNKN